MPTKTPAKKKNVKVTQLDRIEKDYSNIIRAIDASDEAAESQFASILATLGEVKRDIWRMHNAIITETNAIDETVDRIESRLPVPEPKEPEPWVPKVGDWVVLVGKGDTNRSGWLEQFYQAIGSILRVDGLSKDTKDAIHATINGEDWDFDFEWLRPATQSEIDAHLEAEWAAITELQDGDACAELSKRQLQELKDILCADGIFPEGGPTVHYERGTALSGSWRKSEHPQWNWLPYPEFLRRAKGTSARLKAGRKAEEAKPIEFGTLVKVNGSEKKWVYLRKSTQGAQDHLLAHENGTLLFHRSKFTVISPKP